MAHCNLCPGGRQLPDDEMAEHLRTAHPEIAADGTRKSDDSTIVRDVTSHPAPDIGPGEDEGDWRSS